MTKALINILRNKKILSLAREGMDLNQISEELDYCLSTVREVLKEEMDEDEYQLFKAKNYSKKYSLWPVSIVRYQKGRPEGSVCFSLIYNGRRVNIGTFEDFISVILIHNLIKEFTE